MQIDRQTTIRHQADRQVDMKTDMQLNLSNARWCEEGRGWGWVSNRKLYNRSLFSSSLGVLCYSILCIHIFMYTMYMDALFIYLRKHIGVSTAFVFV